MSKGEYECNQYTKFQTNKRLETKIALMIEITLNSTGLEKTV